MAIEEVWRLSASGELRSAPGHWPPRFRGADVEAFASRPGQVLPRAGSRRQGVTRKRPSAPGLRADGADQAMTLAAAARLLGVGRQALQGFLARGELMAVGSPPRIRRRDLDAFVERCQIKPVELDHMDPNVGRRANGGARLTRAGLPDRRYGRR